MNLNDVRKTTQTFLHAEHLVSEAEVLTPLEFDEIYEHEVGLSLIRTTQVVLAQLNHAAKSGTIKGKYVASETIEGARSPYIHTLAVIILAHILFNSALG